jgi:hypothetical protein
MKTSKRNFALLALGLASSLALGQNADKNGAGPTRNDYRLLVIEPTEGAIIAGTRVQVTVNLDIPGQPADERRNGNTMPQPNVVVFLDDERRGNLKDLDNVLTLDNVTPGRHSITLLAMNKHRPQGHRLRVDSGERLGGGAGGRRSRRASESDAGLKSGHAED